MGLLLLLAGVLLPGCWAVRGPGTVWGYVGGSLSVNCTYQAGQEMKPKFWCYPGTLYTCAADIIITSSVQPAVRQNRFSIRDNRTRREFTVTMEGLAIGDAGTYICGVRTGTFKADEHHFVKMIVAQGQSPHVPRPHSTSAHHTAGVSHPHHWGTAPCSLCPIVPSHQILPALSVLSLRYFITPGGSSPPCATPRPAVGQPVPVGTRSWAQGMSLPVPSSGTSPHGGTLVWGCCVSTELGVGCRVNPALCVCAFWGGLGPQKASWAGAGDYNPPTSRRMLWTWQRGPSFSWYDSKWVTSGSLQNPQHFPPWRQGD
uniref:Immunoglobulin domain-containing protein n=1 Tax=Bubo bubo TaxID=30461 RepID=A0A8C0IGP5_BUBBB